MFNSTFLAFLNEAQFTKELLAIGVTQLFKANYATKGIYYQSFTCLSTGLERIGKLCLILDYYISNEGRFPEEKYIRGHSHGIMSLFESCKEVVENQDIQFRFPCDLSDDIHQSILCTLNDFAKSSGRYSNINILLGKSEEQNCMGKWYDEVDFKLYEKHISINKKQAIKSQAFEIGTIMQQFSSVLHTTEDGCDLNNPIKASERTGIWKAVAPYRQLYTLQIIRFFVEIINELRYKAIKTDSENIPYFGEVFGVFYNNDSFFKSRKTWDNL